jgi:hypothetical protein
MRPATWSTRLPKPRSEAPSPPFVDRPPLRISTTIVFLQPAISGQRFPRTAIAPECRCRQRAAVSTRAAADLSPPCGARSWQRRVCQCAAVIPVRMRQTRMHPVRGESPPGFKCQTRSTRTPRMPTSSSGIPACRSNQAQHRNRAHKRHPHHRPIARPAAGRADSTARPAHTQFSRSPRCQRA